MKRVDLIKYWEIELDFINRTIQELTRVINQYNNISEENEVVSLTEYMMSDSGTNQNIVTSYHVNLENYKFKRKIIEDTLRSLR